MIRHLLKLVWRRKRANALIVVEIFLSFLILFAVTTLATTLITRYRRPLGFDYHDVWVAGIAFPDPKAAHGATVERLLAELRSLPQIEAAAASASPAYQPGTWATNGDSNGIHYEFTRDSVTDSYANVMRVRLLSGRWFDARDEASGVPAMVLDSDAAAQFGARAAVGRILELSRDERYHVVGIVAPFRKSGEFSPDRVNMAFDRSSLQSTSGMMPHYIVLRVRPGTPAIFEQTPTQRMHAVAPDFPVRIIRMDSFRTRMNRVFLQVAVAAATVAAFLITMVALGLSGVLWQTVTRRTREIGLRRALGATGSEVNRQILIEVALLSTLALVAGVIIVAQLPLLGIFRLVTPLAFGIGIAGSLATIYALTLLCGVYPSWLAGRVQPAQALHYE